ncbi:MAG: IclR family transcriptional regulator [Lautropia sp.]
MSSLESAVSILKCFSPDLSELAVTEVASRLAMPKSTASRLLQTMAELGLVEQDAATRRYRVGLLPFRLGQLYYAHVRVVDLVEAEVEALVDETGFTGYIGVLNGSDIVILRKQLGRYPVQMVLDAGTRLDAANTAFGKALLARSGDDELRVLLSATPVGRNAGGRAAGGRSAAAGLLTELEQVRRQRWAFGDSVYPGMCAIGAAVGSCDDQQAVGFSLSFPGAAVDQAARRAIALRVVEAARKVAAATADPLWAGARASPTELVSKTAARRARTARA